MLSAKILSWLMLFIKNEDFVVERCWNNHFPFTAANQANGFATGDVRQEIQPKELTSRFGNIYDESNHVKQDENSNIYEEVQSATSIPLERDLNNPPISYRENGRNNTEFPTAPEDQSDYQANKNEINAKINEPKPEQQYSSLNEKHRDNYQALVIANSKNDTKMTYQSCPDVTYAELEPSQPIYRTLTNSYSGDT